MMTPRSVVMGNKVYKLHVKHGSNKECFAVSPELTIDQLQERIAESFQVLPDDQVLICNGKLMQFNGTMSLKQARIPNGSKILLQRCSETRIAKQPGAGEEGEGGVGVGGGSGDAQGVQPPAARGEHSGQENGEQDLQNIEAKGTEAENIVRQLGQEISRVKEQSSESRLEDLKRLKRECGMQGEVVMKYLESLDQLRFTEEMVEARASRKRVANLLNRVLDINDENIQSISTFLSTQSKDL